MAVFHKTTMAINMEILRWNVRFPFPTENEEKVRTREVHAEKARQEEKSSIPERQGAKTGPGPRRST